MKAIRNFISSSLEQRKLNNSLRSLIPENSLLDFCSNDYLGFARSDKLRHLFETELRKYPDYRLGSSGSRLLAGNDDFTEQLEKDIANFHDSGSALLFNSGYDANVGVFSSLPQRGDTIITDELIHASIIDGTRLSHASRYTFKHNDLENLEQKIKLSKEGKLKIEDKNKSEDTNKAINIAFIEIAKIDKVYSDYLKILYTHNVISII